MNAHTEIRREAPNNIEAEQALLGAIMVNNDAFWRVADFLEPDHFYESVHGRIYEVAGEMIRAGKSANPITIKTYLPVALTEDLPMAKYLAQLAADAVTIINTADYGQAITDLATRRRIISVCEDAATIAYDAPFDIAPARIIGDVAEQLAVAEVKSGSAFKSEGYGDVLLTAASSLYERREDGRSFDWFLSEVTDVAGMVRRGNLVGLMSDSGGGKTSFALQQCRHMATSGVKTAFFSIEITDHEAALQMAAQAAKIPLERLDEYDITEKEAEAFVIEQGKAKQLPLRIVPFSDCTLSDVRVKCEALKRSFGVEFVIIDHAKMIALPGKPGDIFSERINALYRGLKGLAKSLDICIVILIQRNDQWRNRDNPRPVNGDAYGGGSVKQSLDVWFSLYRPEPLYRELIDVAKSQTLRDKYIKGYENSRGRAWIINHKRRRGQPAKSKSIKFIGEYTAFESDQDDSEPEFEGFGL